MPQVYKCLNKKNIHEYLTKIIDKKQVTEPLYYVILLYGFFVLSYTLKYFEYTIRKASVQMSQK